MKLRYALCSSALAFALIFCPVKAEAQQSDRVLEGGTVESGTYESSGSVTARNTTVQSGSDVTFRAGERVRLEAGFEVEAGASFLAETDPEAGNDPPPEGSFVNDPLYSQQTYLDAIDIEGAWSVTTGDADQKIALIGAGSVFPTHEDLGAKTTIGSVGQYKDGTEEFFPDTQEFMPVPSAYQDIPFDYQSSLSTSAAGIAAAITNNAEGIAGANWNASILSYDPVTYEGPLNPEGLPVFSSYSVLDLSKVDGNIENAVDNGADFLLTNFSVFYDDDPPEEIEFRVNFEFETDLENYTTFGFFPNLLENAQNAFNYLKDLLETDQDYLNAQAAVRDAVRAGRTVIAPVGDYTGTDAVGLPASTSSDGMAISVGATNQTGDQSYEYSAAGDEDLDFVAPGVNLLTTVNDGSDAYGNITSTNASAALVTGAASLLQAADPDMKPEDFRQVLRRTAVDIGIDPGRDAETGYGRIDAGAAMDYVQERTFTRGIATNGEATLVDETFKLALFNGAWSSNSAPDGVYFTDVYEVTFDVSFPVGSDQDIWIRPGQTKGWARANPNYQDRSAVIRNVDPSDGTATFVTYVYENVCSPAGPCAGDLPVSSEDAQVAYTVATRPGTPPTQPLKASVTQSGSNATGSEKTFTASAEDGPQGEPYTYRWSYAYDPEDQSPPVYGDLPFDAEYTFLTEETKRSSTDTYSTTVYGDPGDDYGYRVTIERGSMSATATTTFSILRDLGGCIEPDGCECPPGELCVASAEDTGTTTEAAAQSSSMAAPAADSTAKDSTGGASPPGLTAGGQSAMQLSDGRWVVAAAGVPADSLRALARRVESGDLNLVAASSGQSAAEAKAAQSQQPGRTLPTEFALQGTYPNPARQNVQVTFDLPEKASVDAALYDALGRRVQRREKSAVAPGRGRQVTFDVSSLSSGVYLFRLRAGEAAATGKIVVVR